MMIWRDVTGRRVPMEPDDREGLKSRQGGDDVNYLLKMGVTVLTAVNAFQGERVNGA